VFRYIANQDPPGLAQLRTLEKDLDRHSQGKESHAVNPDVGQFKAQGASSSVSHGWNAAVPAVRSPPLITISYYESVRNTWPESRELASSLHGPRHGPLGGAVRPQSLSRRRRAGTLARTNEPPPKSHQTPARAHEHGRYRHDSAPLPIPPNELSYKGTGSIYDAGNFSCKPRGRDVPRDKHRIAR